jgi:hypothetical protein
LVCRGFIFYMLLVLFTNTSVERDFHVIWCLCGLTVIWRVSHVEQELLTLPKHMGSARSLVFCATFCRSLFLLCYFSFGHCVVCSSSIDRFWLPIWYIQTLLLKKVGGILIGLNCGPLIYNWIVGLYQGDIIHGMLKTK